MAGKRESSQRTDDGADELLSDDMESELVMPYRPSKKLVAAVAAALGLFAFMMLVRNEMLEKHALREEIVNLQLQRNTALRDARAIKQRVAKATEDKNKQAQRLAEIEQQRVSAEAKLQREAELLRQQNAPGWVAQTYPDGSGYEGYTADSERHGIGKYSQGNDTVYIGIWTKGGINQGVIEFADGEIYQGDISKYRQNGVGQSTWGRLSRRLGDRYFGEYKNGWRSGIGRYTWDNGDVYEGDFVDDYCNGKGRMTFANGDTYEGDFVWGERTGQGRFTWHDKSFYIGSFDGGEISGYGERRHIDGSVDSGSWKNGALVARYPQSGSRRTARAFDQTISTLNADWNPDLALYGAYFKGRENVLGGSLCRYSDGSQLQTSTLRCPLNN